MPHLELIHSENANVEISPSMDDETAAAAARAIVRLFEHWGLSDLDACALLGDVPPRTWARWKKGVLPRLSRDTRARLSNLLGIHKALRIIFSDSDRAYRWIKAENDAFNGSSALEIMRAGELTDLMRVRRYLDSECGAW